MWKIAWGIVLGLLLWHTLPLIVALLFGLLAGTLHAVSPPTKVQPPVTTQHRGTAPR